MIFLMLYSINWPNFIVWLLLLLEILGNLFITNVCYPGCEVKNFEINLIFLIKLLFCLTKKSREKVKYFEKEKSFLKWNKKHFSSILKSIQLLKLSQSWEFAFKTNYDNINKKHHHKFVVKLSQHWKKIISRCLWFSSEEEIIFEDKLSKDLRYLFKISNTASRLLYYQNTITLLQLFKIIRSIISIILEQKQSHKVSYSKIRIATNFNFFKQWVKNIHTTFFLHEERRYMFP